MANRQDPAQAPADGFPVRNQGGMAAPTASQPRAVLPPPAVRSRKDSIVRPVSPGGAAGLPGGGFVAPPAPPPPPGGAVPTGATAPGSRAAQTAQPIAGAPEVPGLEPQPEVQTKITSPDGSTFTAKGPPGSEAQARAEEQAQGFQEQKARDSAPSPVKGVPMKTYEEAVNPNNAPTSASPKAREAWSREAEKQLGDFGEYPGKDDPDAPNPPIRPFGQSFNPFNGNFTNQKAGPSPLAMLGVDFDKHVQDYLSGRANNGS